MIKGLRIIDENEVALNFIAKPNQKKEGFALDAQGNLMLKVNAPAQEGKANERIVALISELLGCPKSHIILVRGETSRHKEVRLQKSNVRELEKILSEYFLALNNH